MSTDKEMLEDLEKLFVNFLPNIYIPMAKIYVQKLKNDTNAIRKIREYCKKHS